MTPEPIGVDQGKAIIMSRLQLSEPSPGFMHFPNETEYDDEYFAQLTAERLVTRYTKGRPRQEWVQTRARNEALDVRVYGLACVRLIGNKSAPKRSNAAQKTTTDNEARPKQRKRQQPFTDQAWL